MGTFLKIVGVISIIVGIIFIVTVIGVPVGASMIIQGVALFALGAIYNGVRELKAGFKE